MGAIDNFLKRWGYAKLDRYGLLLTAEDRVLSNRPAVLDDGLGGKIVGWIDGDLAAMELERWGAPKAKPVAATTELQSPSARRPPATAPQRPPNTSAPATATQPPSFVASPPPVVIAPPPAVVVKPAPVPAAVEAEPPVGEDEWEWEIAMARARAAADEALAAVKTMPAAKPIAADPMASWPTTEPLGESWGEVSEPAAPRVMSPVSKTLIVKKRIPAHQTPTRGTAPARPAAPTPMARPGSRTVIPVPSLPVAARPQDVRPPARTPSAPLRSLPHLPTRTRLARGTNEDTVQTRPAPAAANDDTSPYVTLPAEANATGNAQGRRVAAKHR